MFNYLSTLNLSLHKLYIASIPILSSLLTIFIHSTGSSMKINLPLSLGIIAVSTINLLFQKSSTVIRDSSEIITLCCGLGILAQFLFNITMNSQYRPLIDLALKLFEKKIIINLLPILFSGFVDLGIMTVLKREHAVIFKAISSVLTIVIMTVVRKELIYDWRILLPLLIIPSFFLMFFLPSTPATNPRHQKADRYRRACTRMSCFITSLTITITCFILLIYLINRNSNVSRLGNFLVSVGQRMVPLAVRCKNGLSWCKRSSISLLATLKNKAQGLWSSFVRPLQRNTRQTQT